MLLHPKSSTIQSKNTAKDIERKSIALQSILGKKYSLCYFFIVIQFSKGNHQEIHS